MIILGNMKYTKLKCQLNENFIIIENIEII